MFKVYNSLDFIIMVTDNEAEAEFMAWLNDGYYI